MKRDTTAIIQADCTTIVDDKTIQVIDGTRIQTYKLVSNKYENTLNQPYTPVSGESRTCYTSEQINDIQSPYDFITPIYHTIAIISALTLFYFAYRLIIYPWFRTKI